MGLIGQTGHPQVPPPPITTALGGIVGLPGDAQPRVSQVQQAVRDAIAACRAAGVPAGCIAGDENVCRGLLDEDGASFVAVGTDLMLLAARVRSLTAALAKPA